MKICLVHEEYPNETNFGGIATYQKRMAEEFVRLGNEVVVIARGLSKNQHYYENGVEVYRIYNKTTDNQINDYTLYRKKVATLLKKLQTTGLDIIEVPDWGAETILFEKARRVPMVVRLHTPLKVWLKFNKNNFGEVTNQMLEWEESSLLNANVVTCCSEILKNMICKDFPIKPKSVIVTPNPANLTNFYKDTSIKKTNSLLYVGSLEERKGVVVLAKALNIFFKKHPHAKCYFIGKDTTRNAKNISTKEYIKSLVHEKYRNNLEFLGQLPNTSLNEYYNMCNVAVFPSLFDNFPYVTLEAMATGIHVVGSKNSGMVEMLNDDSAIYKTPNYKHLASKITEKYELSLNTAYNENNIKRVKSMYDAEPVCKNMLELYTKAISDYYIYNFEQKEIKNVLKKCGIEEEIISCKRNNRGVANAVIEVETKKNTYVIKRYNNNNINFALSNKLYNKYTKYGISVCQPLNSQLIKIGTKRYNVFPYIKGKHTKLNKNSFNFLAKLVSIKRKSTQESSLYKKCENYYNILKNSNIENLEICDEIKYVLNRYENIKTQKFVQEQYLNHGDLSGGNILNYKNKYCVIDFDEAIIGPKLYDYAVVCIKFFRKNEKLDTKLCTKLKNKVKKSTKNHQDADFDNILIYYLCKILLEKFALHIENKIDLFSIRQRQDFYKRYLNMLKEIN